MEKLELFFSRLADFISMGKAAPMSIWQGTAGQPWLRVFMLCCLLGLAGAIIGTLLSFFKAGWKDKLRMLLADIIVIIVLLVIFYFALM